MQFVEIQSISKDQYTNAIAAKQNNVYNTEGKKNSVKKRYNSYTNFNQYCTGYGVRVATIALSCTLNYG